MEIHKLIALLLAIKGYSKNIHYTCHGDSFYGKHIFADRIESPINDYIDRLKEVCLLGKLPEGVRPLTTSEYDELAKQYYPETKETDDKYNFDKLQQLISDTLIYIEQLENLTKGDENLIGAIAEHLQQMNGLLNLQNI